MFNNDGEVVDIVSHILSKSGGYEGLGFAVSSNTAKRFLFERRSVWGGLTRLQLCGRVAKVLNIPQTCGELVQRVANGSPAWKMGVRGGTIKATIDGKELLIGGDIILEVMEIQIGKNSYHKIREKVNNLPVGKTIEGKVLRGSKVITLSTKLEK